VRVVLVEAGPRVLAGFDDDLSGLRATLAGKHRRRGGAEQPVTECSADCVVYGGTVWRPKHIWAPASAPRPPPNGWAAEADRAGRLQVLPDLTVPGHPESSPSRYRHHRWPGRQTGPRHRAGRQAAGKLCRRHHQGALERSHDAPFHYKHAGSLAQIGKRKR